MRHVTLDFLMLLLTIIIGCSSNNNNKDDEDSDGIVDGADNCPSEYNPDQMASIGVVTTLGYACDDEDADAIFDAVRQVLKQIIHYYQKSEPSSPVVELAYLAHDLLAKPFFAVLQVLSPTEKDNFSMVLDSLSSNPLAFLIGDCYQRSIAGSGSPKMTETSAPTPGSQSTETASIPTDVPSVPIASADSGSEFATPTPQILNSTHEPGAITSRSDVIAAIRELELFFPQNEPASVVPLILAEMRKIVPKNFTELLAEFSRSKSVGGDGTTGGGN